MSAMTGAWTRRRFGQTLAAAAVAGTVSLRWRRAAPSIRNEVNGFGFASTGEDERGGSLHAFRVSDGEWRLLSVLLNGPAGRVLMHPSLPVLYVLHDVAEWGYLPRGAVSAYRFDPASGMLTHLSTQPLSLAATHPRDGAVFSKGAALFVTTAAGIYNVLPLQSDGSVRPVSAIRKQIGVCAEDGRSSLWRVLLHPDDETIFASYPPQRYANVFRVSHGQILLIEHVPGTSHFRNAIMEAHARRTRLEAAPGAPTLGVRSCVFWAA